MSVQLAKQPKCVCCGKDIRKATDHIRFTGVGGSHVKPVAGKEICRTKAEAQRFCNLPIVSLSYSKIYGSDLGVPIDRVISSVHVWDGKSYVDAWFCNGNCRTTWAYRQAKAQMPYGNIGRT